MFPLADFGEDAGFFRCFFEALESAFNGFAVFDTDGRHWLHHLLRFWQNAAFCRSLRKKASKEEF